MAAMKTTLPTEPIGSIPRPQVLIDALTGKSQGDVAKLTEEAVRDTLSQFEATGSPVITDGEQRKSSFVTYPLSGLTNLAASGIVIPFADGHTRQLPVLTSGPFKYGDHASNALEMAKNLTKKPLKQAVISASAMALLYPADGIKGYPREQFIHDLIKEAQNDIRRCLDLGAIVQIDFTEGRLAVKLDPSKGLLKSFIDLNNHVLSAFSAEEKKRIGVHTCPGGDHDSTHSADVDYREFLPDFMQLDVGNFYIQLSSEKDKVRALEAVKPFVGDKKRLFVGVTDPISRKIETAQEVSQQIMAAARIIRPEFLGTTDDCGFSPFCDDVSTSREVAFAKIRARVEGNELASKTLN
jgi:5-methyltetrahydropteroyltriglutamate--homocysteine methyltransferase